MTPFQIIAVLPKLHLKTRYLRETPGAGPNPAASRRETLQPPHRRGPGRVPFHIGCVTSLLSTSSIFLAEQRLRLHNGRQWRRHREVASIPIGEKRRAPKIAQSAGICAWLQIAPRRLPSAPQRPSRQSLLQSVQAPARRCQSARPRRECRGRKSAETRRRTPIRCESCSPAAPLARCWAQDENHTPDNRKPPPRSLPCGRSRLPRAGPGRELAPASYSERKEHPLKHGVAGVPEPPSPDEAPGRQRTAVKRASAPARKSAGSQRHAVLDRPQRQAVKVRCLQPQRVCPQPAAPISRALAILLPP